MASYFFSNKISRGKAVLPAGYSAARHKNHMNYYQTRFSDKLKEALKAVAPIIGIVLLLSFTIAPIPPSILLLFLFGAVLLIVGMMFFTLGAELSMTPMGEKVGTKMAKTMHLGTILFLCFLLGFVITISEPDLQVLAEQVPSIPNYWPLPAESVFFWLWQCSECCFQNHYPRF